MDYKKASLPLGRSNLSAKVRIKAESHTLWLCVSSFKKETISQSPFLSGSQCHVSVCYNVGLLKSSPEDAYLDSRNTFALPFFSFFLPRMPKQRLGASSLLITWEGLQIFRDSVLDPTVQSQQSLTSRFVSGGNKLMYIFSSYYQSAILTKIPSKWISLFCQ